MSIAEKIPVASLIALILLIAPQFVGAQEEGGDEPPAPSVSEPYDYKNEGIFGCNQIAGAAGSAGAMAAIGGVYVPVNDAAVTLNTGILVYKECVLRPVQVKLREGASVSILRKNVVGIQTGREGNPQYAILLAAEDLAVSDDETYAFLTDGTLDGLKPEFKKPIEQGLARRYMAQTRSDKDLECKYVGTPGETGTGDVVLSNFELLADAPCNPYLAYLLAEQKMSGRIARAIECQRQQLEWGRGFYSKTGESGNPCTTEILTPSSVVQESFQQVLGSPVRQLEQADDIGQIVGALFSGITTQALTDTRGLSGISQTTGGRSSYLDRVSQESSQSIIGTAVNAALAILNGARQTEGLFLAAMNSIASSLTEAIQKLRQTETACWTLVVPKVREYASTNDITLDQAKIRAATSSLAFAQQVIDSQITPLADVALTNVQAAERAFGLIDQLIAGVTNTTSVSAQRLALEQLDTLVDQKALHRQTDVDRANRQRDDVASAMATLVTDTAKVWGDSSDASAGWCNINNSSVIEQWADRWER